MTKEIDRPIIYGCAHSIMAQLGCKFRLAPANEKKKQNSNDSLFFFARSNCCWVDGEDLC
jgi:hypothetical protein